MKKNIVFLTVVFLTIVFSGNSFASTIDSDIIVIKAVISDYYGIEPEVVLESGHQYWVTGLSGTQLISFSQPLVVRIRKLRENPDAGTSLMSVCPTQARLIRIVMTPCLKKTEIISRCERNGDCYSGKILTGRHQTLRPYCGVRVVVNSGNDTYPQNSMAFKMEYHKAGLTGWSYGTGWGPTIVIRNPKGENPLALIRANEYIFDYLDRVWALKKGQPGSEGDSCYEVVVLRNGTIYKDESPAEAPFI